MSQPEHIAKGIRWNPEISIGSLIAAIAFVLTGFSVYATFQSGYAVTQTNLQGLTSTVKDQGSKLDDVSRDVTAQKVLTETIQRDVADLKAQVREMQRK